MKAQHYNAIKYVSKNTEVGPINPTSHLSKYLVNFTLQVEF